MGDTPTSDEHMSFTDPYVESVPYHISQMLERKLAAAIQDRDCWIFNAKQLQKQVNEWEPERAALKNQLAECQALLKVKDEALDKLIAEAEQCGYSKFCKADAE